MKINSFINAFYLNNCHSMLYTLGFSSKKSHSLYYLIIDIPHSHCLYTLYKIELRFEIYVYYQRQKK